MVREVEDYGLGGCKMRKGVAEVEGVRVEGEGVGRGEWGERGVRSYWEGSSSALLVFLYILQGLMR